MAIFTNTIVQDVDLISENNDDFIDIDEMSSNILYEMDLCNHKIVAATYIMDVIIESDNTTITQYDPKFAGVEPSSDKKRNIKETIQIIIKKAIENFKSVLSKIIQ